MTEFELIVDLHRETDRQGPGSEADTLKALSFLNLPGDRICKVADIGCGTGGQTITLAKQLNAEITAVDIFSEFLNKLDERANTPGLHEKINCIEASMEELPFKNEELDVIWSEGAIYNIGFEKGIREWRRFLKTGGYLAVSEITWITSERPDELEEYWQTAYPQIDTASNKINILEKNGYSLAGYFYLPPGSWLDSYYGPLQVGIEGFLKRHQQSPEAKNIVAEYQNEIELYNKFKDYYSYGFYIARKL